MLLPIALLCSRRTVTVCEVTRRDVGCRLQPQLVFSTLHHVYGVFAQLLICHSLQCDPPTNPPVQVGGSSWREGAPPQAGR